LYPAADFFADDVSRSAHLIRPLEHLRLCSVFHLEKSFEGPTVERIEVWSIRHNDKAIRWSFADAHVLKTALDHLFSDAGFSGHEASPHFSVWLATSGFE
jgi:hypothetical protein